METISRKEALEKGLKFYFTGIPCKRDHVDIRYTSSACCKICRELATSKWQRDNKQKDKDNKKSYRKETKEKFEPYYKKYREENKENIKEYHVKYYQENKEKHAAQMRAYYENHKNEYIEREKQLKKINPGYFTKKSATYKASKVNATPSWLTKGDLDNIKLIYIEAAERSQRDGIKYHVDHLVPLHGKTVSGLHVPWNLQILEATKNMSKGNKHAL